MTNPDVSFVIPSYNSGDTLPLCLRAVTGQKAAVPFEVLVVDSSQDGTPETLAQVFPEVKWVRLPVRTAPGAARNRGLAQAAAPIIVFVDSDVILESHWLECAINRLQSGVAGVCGAVEPYPESNPLGFCLFLIQFSKFLPVGSARPLGLAPSYAVLVRKSEAAGSGGFPEDFPMLEDFLFSRRLSTESGRPFLFCPEMRAFHVNKREWRVIRSQLRSHGFWSGRARLKADLPGRFLKRGRIAVPLLIPYRALLILCRTLRWDFLAFLKGLLLMPAIILGLSVWARSFLWGISERDA